MKAVFLLFDSLNRHLLEPYRGTRIATPNFARLAERSVTFERHYVGSMPCMPARRDMQTGRLSFLHRSWGPLEPFDNSFPELLFGSKRLQSLGDRPFPLFRGWRRHLPQPLRLLRFRARTRGRCLEGDGPAALGAAAREVPRAAVQRSAARLLSQEHHQPRVHQEEKDYPVGPVLRQRDSSSSISTAMPTTGSCRSRPSTRTSRSRRRRASARRSRPAGTGRSATGHATAGSTSCPRSARSCAPTTTPSSRCATSCWASCSTISTPTTCGRTRRSSSPPTTASCSASTTSGRRTG